MDLTPKIDLRIPTAWLARLDEVRGDQTRSDFIRQALFRSLGAGVPRFESQRGKWDRLPIMLPERADAELRRRARNEKRRTNRKPRKPPVAPAVEFTFHPTGQITSSDLDVLATFVGFVDDRGIYLPESHRYPIDRVRQELLQQMESEPERSWPERFQLFLARSDR